MKKLVFAAVTLVIAAFWLPASAQEESLAAAARRAREQKKDTPRAKRVYTNDELPSESFAGVSVVGSAAVTPSSGDTSATSGAGDQNSSAGAASGGAGGGAAAGAKAAEKDKESADEEKTWRKKFSELRGKIATAEKELDIMQRELNLKRQQYYSDPNVALREQYRYPSGSGGDINDTVTKINDKKKELDALRQQLSELEDDLRRAGAPASWARE